MGSDESHFNVSLIVRDKATRQFPQYTTFSKRRESRSGIEPRALLLTSLTPYRQAVWPSGSLNVKKTVDPFKLIGPQEHGKCKGALTPEGDGKKSSIFLCNASMRCSPSSGHYTSTLAVPSREGDS